MQLYVIRRPSAWASLAELEVAGAKSAQVGDEEMPDSIRWIRSYVVHEADGRIGTFCIYEAKDGDAIRDHAAPRRHARRGVLRGGDHRDHPARPGRDGDGLTRRLPRGAACSAVPRPGFPHHPRAQRLHRCFAPTPSTLTAPARTL